MVLISLKCSTKSKFKLAPWMLQIGPNSRLKMRLNSIRKNRQNSLFPSFHHIIFLCLIKNLLRYARPLYLLSQSQHARLINVIQLFQTQVVIYLKPIQRCLHNQHFNYKTTVCNFNHDLALHKLENQKDKDPVCVTSSKTTFCIWIYS